MANTLLYYITDRKAFAGDEPERRRRLLKKIEEACRCGVNYIQLREKDLPARDLESLAHEAVLIVQGPQLRTENRELRAVFLLNSRTDIALATRADGVHLRADDISPAEARSLWKRSPASEGMNPTIGVSCHSVAEVALAAANHADFAVFAPVFEKKDARGVPPTGLAQLRDACRASIPVLALGGVTLENYSECLDAGAAGIAAIRLFQENDIAEVVAKLRR